MKHSILAHRPYPLISATFCSEPPCVIIVPSSSPHSPDRRYQVLGLAGIYRLLGGRRHRICSKKSRSTYRHPNERCSMSSIVFAIPQPLSAWLTLLGGYWSRHLTPLIGSPPEAYATRMMRHRPHPGAESRASTTDPISSKTRLHTHRLFLRCLVRTINYRDLRRTRAAPIVSRL